MREPIIERGFQQGTDSWIKARLGVVTASCMDSVITAGGDLSKQQESYMHSLLSEWLSGQADDTWKGNWYTDRGKTLEPDARVYYATFQTDEPIEEVGFVYFDEKKLVGCSPDALVGESGGLEIKSPARYTHCSYLIKNVLRQQKKTLEADYRVQVQASLWITQREWWEIQSFAPRMKPVLARVFRDEVFIRKMEIAVAGFLDMMAEQKETLRKHDIFPEFEEIVI